MKFKFLSIVIALLFILTLVPPARAAYSLSLTGAVDFQAEPWTNQTFRGYVIVSMGNASQSSLDIMLSVSGDIAPWLSWTDLQVFTLYPDQQRIVHYEIDFPASAPGEYTGDITASGVPSASAQTGGAAVPGNMALAIGVSINIPARVYLMNVYADGIGAASEVYNGQNSTFSGNVSYNLTRDSEGLDTQTAGIANLAHNQSAVTSVQWSTVLELGVDYEIIFTLTGPNNTLVDRQVYSLRLATPADILVTWHTPSVVYEDYDATIYARVQDAAGGLTRSTAHYTVDGGAEQTAAMDYDSFNNGYIVLIENTSYTVGSLVEYWVTSVNDASGAVYTGVSPHNSFRVYSSTAPDLVIDGSSLAFSPIDPRNATMYDTNSTNIFVTVRNAGRGDVYNVVVRMYDYNDTVDSKTISFIASGDSATARFSYGSPAAGTHLLRFVADPDDAVAETDENNNYISVEITVQAAPEPPEVQGEGSPLEIIPYILVPLILAMLIILFLRRKRVVSVTVASVKPSRHSEDGVQRWIYSCSVAGRTIGNTRATKVRAEEGSVIQVRVSGIKEDEEGNLAWWNPEVLGPAEKEDDLETVRRIAKQAKGS